MRYINTILFGYCGVLILLLISCDSSQTGAFSVTNLQTEYVENPLGIDANHPRLSWNLKSKARDIQQKAYQIIVASSRRLLTVEKADIWNSQKITSAKTVNITYDGKPLRSDQSYYWKVQVWNQDASHGWSDTGTFHTGLLELSNWKGVWISPQDTSISAPLLRRKFTADKSIKKATAFITGVGYYEFYLNGHKVGKHVLDPAMTDYQKRVLYATYDVTEQLKDGANVAGIMLGNGAWRMRTMKNRYTWHNHSFGTPRAILQLNIQFKDGSEAHIVTNKKWKASAGPIVYSNVYGGEDYDARREQSGWLAADFDDSEWEKVKEVKSPGGELESQLMQPIKVVKTIQPVKRTHPDKQTYLFDLGQNMPGWWRIHVKGKKSTTLRIRGAETLNDSLFPASLRAGDRLSTKQDYHSQVYTDYTLKGRDEEVYEPHFFYTGFRYVEVTTDQPEGVESIDVEGRVVHTALKRTGHFVTSDSLLNKIHKAAVWSQIGNTHSYPSDCPHREKGAYTGDGEVIAEAAMHDFNMVTFYTNWVADMRDAQRDNGRILNTSPTLIGGHGGGIAWGSAYILIPWWMHQYYGDVRVLREHYPTMKKYMGYLHNLARNDSTSKEEYIINNFGGYWDSLGEWCAPGQSDGPNHPLVSTAYWYIDAMKFAKVADILGKSKDARHYRALADTIRQAFNRKFFDSGTNLYGASTPYQTYLVLASAHHLVPPDHKKAVLENLKDDIIHNHNSHLDTGILGTKYLLPLLTEAGMGDLAYSIVTQKTYPGWGYWMENGATTLWEKWSGKESHNHQMFGSVDEFFYKYLAGIRAPTSNGTTAGYQRTLIRPYIPKQLNHAEASLETVHGTIKSSWTKKENQLKLNVTFPANTTGKVSIPVLGSDSIKVTESGKQIWDGTKFVDGVDGISHGVRQSRYITFDVASGDYNFEL